MDISFSSRMYIFDPLSLKEVFFKYHIGMNNLLIHPKYVYVPTLYTWITILFGQFCQYPIPVIILHIGTSLDRSTGLQEGC